MATSKLLPAAGDTTTGLLSWLRSVTVGALVVLTAATTPSPSHRPQVGRWGTFYVKGYEVYKNDCLQQFSVQKPPVPMVGHLAAVVETIVQRPKKTVLTAPKGDTDNYTKAPLDSATKAGVWGDDTQVIALGAIKRWAAAGEEPGVKLYVGAMKV